MIEPKSEPTCADCRFFRRSISPRTVEFPEEQPRNWGDCRRRCPSVDPVKLEDRWPLVDLTGWCGEWEPRP